MRQRASVDLYLDGWVHLPAQANYTFTKGSVVRNMTSTLISRGGMPGPQWDSIWRRRPTPRFSLQPAGRSLKQDGVIAASAITSKSSWRRTRNNLRPHGRGAIRNCGTGGQPGRNDRPSGKYGTLDRPPRPLHDSRQRSRGQSAGLPLGRLLARTIFHAK